MRMNIIYITKYNMISNSNLYYIIVLYIYYLLNSYYYSCLAWDNNVKISHIKNCREIFSNKLYINMTFTFYQVVIKATY